MNRSQLQWVRVGLAVPMACLLVLPVVALLFVGSPSTLWDAVNNPSFGPALWLSVRTSLASLLLVIALGTPLAWALSRARHPATRVALAAVELPVVLPPAVVGLALLLGLGQQGLGSVVSTVAPFTTAAVVLAQVVVAGPFYVLAAHRAFERIDEELLVVAKTLGAPPTRVFFSVALPLALPGLIGGAALCWARALGEFGATLLFAGRLEGVTQTMPLAIYAALETDVSLAIAFALVLTAAAFAVLGSVRLIMERGR